MIMLQSWLVGEPDLQRIKETNPLAEFVPCNNHSLSLVGVHAASASVSAVTFFLKSSKMLYLFAAPTHRWDVLKSNLNNLFQLNERLIQGGVQGKKPSVA